MNTTEFNDLNQIFESYSRVTISIKKDSSEVKGFLLEGLKKKKLSDNFVKDILNDLELNDDDIKTNELEISIRHDTEAVSLGTNTPPPINATSLNEVERIKIIEIKFVNEDRCCTGFSRGKNIENVYNEAIKSFIKDYK